VETQSAQMGSLSNITLLKEEEDCAIFHVYILEIASEVRNGKEIRILTSLTNNIQLVYSYSLGVVG